MASFDHSEWRQLAGLALTDQYHYYYIGGRHEFRFAGSFTSEIYARDHGIQGGNGRSCLLNLGQGSHGVRKIS